MMFGLIIGIILIGILFFAASRRGYFRGRTDAPMANSAVSPLTTLENRYAKGEIDEEEFEKRRAELEEAN